MPSDPKTNVSQNSLSDSLDKEIDRLLAAGLENFSVRELLGMMLSAAGAGRAPRLPRREHQRQRQR